MLETRAIAVRPGSSSAGLGAVDKLADGRNTRISDQTMLSTHMFSFPDPCTHMYNNMYMYMYMYMYNM